MAKVYKTMQGREIDMDKLLARNELMPAIGNARVNARGDEIGPGGTIVKKREEIMQEYYEKNPKGKPRVDQQTNLNQEAVVKETRGNNEGKRKN